MGREEGEEIRAARGPLRERALDGARNASCWWGGRDGEGVNECSHLECACDMLVRGIVRRSQAIVCYTRTQASSLTRNG